jgi:hypothetical protein
MGSWDAGEVLAMAKSRNINVEPLDRADRFFLENGLAGGMQIAELAGFLNRSEDEIKNYLTKSSSSAASRARDNQPRSTLKRSTFSRWVGCLFSKSSSFGRPLVVVFRPLAFH